MAACCFSVQLQHKEQLQHTAMASSRRCLRKKKKKASADEESIIRSFAYACTPGSLQSDTFGHVLCTDHTDHYYGILLPPLPILGRVKTSVSTTEIVLFTGGVLTKYSLAQKFCKPLKSDLLQQCLVCMELMSLSKPVRSLCH